MMQNELKWQLMLNKRDEERIFVPMSKTLKVTFNILINIFHNPNVTIIYSCTGLLRCKSSRRLQSRNLNGTL